MRTSRFATMLSLMMLAAVMSFMLSVQSAGAQEFTNVSLSPVQKASLSYAMQSFREQRYSAAYGRLAQLADAGHEPSAQLALVMYRNGPALFGNAWAAAPSQLRLWNTLIINSTRGNEFADEERGD
jgi:hypothetical protein